MLIECHFQGYPEWTLLMIDILHNLQSTTMYSNFRVEAAIILRWPTWNHEKVRGITSNPEVSMSSIWDLCPDRLVQSSAVLVLYCAYVFHDSMKLSWQFVVCSHIHTTPCEGSALVDPITTTKTSQITSPEDKLISMLDKQHHPKTLCRGWGDGTAFRSLSVLADDLDSQHPHRVARSLL